MYHQNAHEEHFSGPNAIVLGWISGVGEALMRPDQHHLNGVVFH